MIQLYEYLSKNKAEIENIKVVKSDTNAVKTNPQKMIDETIDQVEIINQKQTVLKQNAQNFKWYADATQQLCLSAQNQLNSLIKTAIKLLDNYQRIQTSKFEENGKGMVDEQSGTTFYRKYVANHDVAARKEKNSLQNTLAMVKAEIQRKQNEFKRARNQIKEKQMKIDELGIKINGLNDVVKHWEEKADREEKERREAAESERKKIKEELIKLDIILET